MHGDTVPILVGTSHHGVGREQLLSKVHGDYAHPLGGDRHRPCGIALGGWVAWWHGGVVSCRVCVRARVGTSRTSKFPREWEKWSMMMSGSAGCTSTGWTCGALRNGGTSIFTIHALSGVGRWSGKVGFRRVPE